MRLLQMADVASRTRQRDDALGANRSAYERHRGKHPDELGDYNPAIDYGRVEVDEADEVRRTTAARAEREATQREKIEALVATGMTPAMARAHVVAGVDPEAAAELRESRRLMNDLRRHSIREKATEAVTGGGGTKDPNARKLSTLNTQIDDTRADVTRLERDAQKPLGRFATSAD